MRFESESTFVGRLRRRRIRLAFTLSALLVVCFAAAGALRVGPPPTISFIPEPKVIGRQAHVGVQVAEPRRGLSHVVVELVQAGKPSLLVDERFAPLPGWKLWGNVAAERAFELEIGKDAIASLREGEATLRVVAHGAPAWLRRAQPVVVERILPVRLTPPSLEVVSTQHYVSQGGAEAVIYRVGESAIRDGVEVAGWFFPGYPLPGGGPHDRFALFAVPYDQNDATGARLIAADDAGNERSATFVDLFFPRPPRADEIQLDERFLAKVVPEILAETPDLSDAGDLLSNYLQINRELRQTNNATLRELAAKTSPRFLWKRAFTPLPGGQVMSSFADRRTYSFNGREVDHQDHLGFDLASTARAPVPAANAGVVVWARYLGIYGNAVVVDHGYGLMSLYAHLSSIAVAEGAAVEPGAIVGASGATGLAAGDHLHFTFLLHGLPVRPVEWWDSHWIADRLKRKLGDALPFEGGG